MRLLRCRALPRWCSTLFLNVNASSQLVFNRRSTITFLFVVLVFLVGYAVPCILVVFKHYTMYYRVLEYSNASVCVLLPLSFSRLATLPGRANY